MISICIYPLESLAFILILMPLFLSILFFFLLHISTTQQDLLPNMNPRQLQATEFPSSRLDSVTSPQMPSWNAANGYYIKAELLTGKSFLPQHCQSILPNWGESGRESDGVFLGTKNCRMSAINPSSAPYYFHSLLFFFTLLTSPPPPHPHHTHRNSQRGKKNYFVCVTPSHEVRIT